MGVRICMHACRFYNLFSNVTFSTPCIAWTCSDTLQMSPHQRSDVNKLISGIHSVYSANIARLQLGICEPRLNVEHKQGRCHRLPGTHTCNSLRSSELQDERPKVHPLFQWGSHIFVFSQIVKEKINICLSRSNLDIGYHFNISQRNEYQILSDSTWNLQYKHSD